MLAVLVGCPATDVRETDATAIAWRDQLNEMSRDLASVAQVYETVCADASEPALLKSCSAVYSGYGAAKVAHRIAQAAVQKYYEVGVAPIEVDRLFERVLRDVRLVEEMLEDLVQQASGQP